MAEKTPTNTSPSDTTRESLPISELFKPTNVTPPQNREPNVPNPGVTTVPSKF
jgi:hypothetical protein